MILIIPYLAYAEQFYVNFKMAAVENVKQIEAMVPFKNTY